MWEFLGRLVLAAGIMLGAGILGEAYYKAKEIKNPTVRATGIASERYESDIIKWRVAVAYMSPPNNRNIGYQNVSEQIDRLKSYFQKEGIADENITIATPTSYAQYDRNGMISGYNVSQQIFVISKNIAKLETIALKPSALAELNVNMQDSNLEYYYSKLDDLKLKLLSSASANAKDRAIEITKGNSYKVGDLIDARSGIFQITEPYSTETASYGVYNTQSKKKEIRVTVNAQFELIK